MSHELETRLRKREQMTIPTEAVKHLGAHPGDRIVVELAPNGALILRAVRWRSRRGVWIARGGSSICERRAQGVGVSRMTAAAVVPAGVRLLLGTRRLSPALKAFVRFRNSG